jgi:hypothetical protein
MINFAPMPDRNYQYDQGIAFDAANSSVIADPIPPKGFFVSGQRLAELPRIIATFDAFGKIAKNPSLDTAVESPQVLQRLFLKLNRPGQGVFPLLSG